jgi:phospho-N-acetylmuramoyl-pentapeptide-transferase
MDFFGTIPIQHRFYGLTTGIIAVLEYCCPKEMLIPLLCGIFLVENLSVVYTSKLLKYTKKRFGEGRRIF